MPECDHPSPLFTAVEAPNLEWRPPGASAIREALATTCPARKKVKRMTLPPPRSETQNENNVESPPASTFPAPVLVPGDMLFDYPGSQPQSVQDWVDEAYRNEVTDERRTIYVVAPPTNSADAASVKQWVLPNIKAGASSKRRVRSSNQVHAQPLEVGHVIEYLQAFYHNLPVMLLEQPRLQYVPWNAGLASTKSNARRKLGKTASYVGLSTDSEVVRIRCRSSKDGVFRRQLNLNDLLDVAMRIIPNDAYALLMLVHHDMYEDEEDDFCCGRAYGGSRVAVVSTARYRPELDAAEQIDINHSWPGSHCGDWIREQYSDDTPSISPSVQNQMDVRRLADGPSGSAVAAAILTANALPKPSSPSGLSTLWLGRVCKTASHELGHCFGMDHCAYYACIMQATAHLAEDARQPPYLCPVDLSKVLRATRSGEKERYRALLDVCARWKDDRMFSAFGAWIEKRLTQPDIVKL